MNPQAEELKRRTKKFALDVLAFVKTLPADDEANDIARQLRRAGTGVGSGYRSTCRSRSDAEFIARIGTTLDEADESAFWLELIIESKMCVDRSALNLFEEANQLSAIMAQSRITVNKRIEDQKITKSRDAPKSKIPNQS